MYTDAHTHTKTHTHTCTHIHKHTQGGVKGTVSKEAELCNLMVSKHTYVDPKGLASDCMTFGFSTPLAISPPLRVTAVSNAVFQQAQHGIGMQSLLNTSSLFLSRIQCEPCHYQQRIISSQLAKVIP